MMHLFWIIRRWQSITRQYLHNNNLILTIYQPAWLIYITGKWELYHRYITGGTPIYGGIMASIRKRLEELEKRLGGCLPLVVCVFQNGTKNEYKGFPDIDCLLNSDNPIVDVYGSEFAKLVNAAIFPKENRNIDDFEDYDI